jgi:hypothetical protein
MKRISSCSLLLALVALLSLGAPAWAAQVKICHVPPGDPGNFHTITVSDNALQAHLAHGDLAGECSAHCGQLCDDGNACTIDACDASEHCAASHPPVNCDDGNLCTTDTCNPASGCNSAPRVCSDSNLCTVDSCDPLTGNCVFPPAACPSGQLCNPENGNCDDIDECLSEPCMNGECIDGANQYTCQCAPGWTGVNCDVDIDECESQPCANGNCIDGTNQYTCQCLPGWTGTLCDQPQSQTYNCTDRNPCTPENIGNGLFYFAADDPNQFIQCDQAGRCYEMFCPEGFVWNRDLNTCAPG